MVSGGNGSDRMKIQITTKHAASSYGQPVCLIDGEMVDPAPGFLACLDHLGWSRADAVEHLGKSRPSVDKYATGERMIPADVWLVLRQAITGRGI